MVIFPNCKLNIGLNVLEKRNDGFHNIETVFYPLPWHDALEILPAPHFSFISSGLPIDANDDQNLCVQAYQLLKKYHNLPPVFMHLQKDIPLGAGLGGGSSDAAHALLLLNQKFQLNISFQQLHQYAIQLGSDCPFFLINQPVVATGRGEIMEPLDTDPLKDKKIVVVNPGIHINTGWAFSKIHPQPSNTPLKQLVLNPITDWKHTITNQFESAVFQEHPVLNSIKEQLYQAGALYAAMTGSGSTLFGIFEKETALSFLWPSTYTTRTLLL